MENRRDVVSKEEQTSEFLENIFTEVLVPDGHGCVRTYGLGPTPTSIFYKRMGASTSQCMENKIGERVREEIMSEVGAMMAATEKKIREDVRAEVLADIERDTHTQGGDRPTKHVHVPASSSVHCNDIDAEGDQSFDDEDMGVVNVSRYE